MKKIITVLLCILCTSYAQAKVIFVNSKNKAWETEVRNHINNMNQFLDGYIEAPSDFQIVYAKNKNSYYMPRFTYMNQNGVVAITERILFIGDDSLTTLAHEYGHLVFDEYFRKNSKPWQYYLIKSETMDRDLALSERYFSNATSKMKEDLKKYKQKSLAQTESSFDKIIETINHTLKIYESKVTRFQYALELEKESTLDLSAIDSFDALEAHTELFADTFAVLYLNDWSAMATSIHDDLKANPDLIHELTHPPLDDINESIAELLNHRMFHSINSISVYNFKEWEKDSPYWHFQPVRAEIRKMVDGGYNKHAILKTLIEASLTDFHQNMVGKPESQGLSLFEKNLNLLNQLNTDQAFYNQ